MGAEDHAAAGEDRGARRAGACAAGALLAPRLGVAARDQSAGARRGGAAPARGLLGPHRLVQQRPVEAGAEGDLVERDLARARAGSTRSPIFTGGGVVFGPHPRSYTFKINRKERRSALRSALSLHAQRGSLAIIEAGAFDQPSTKSAAALLAGWTEPRPTLVVVTAEERGAGLSFRNIKRVSVLVPENVGVTDLVGAASLVCSAAALEQLTARAVGSRSATEDDA